MVARRSTQAATIRTDRTERTERTDRTERTATRWPSYIATLSRDGRTLDTRRVRCRLVLVLLSLAACYTPSLRPGNPCDEQHRCPMPLVCVVDTCELTASLPSDSPDAAADAMVSTVPDAVSDSVLVADCTVTGPEICGDGIDQDCRDGDAACEPNDTPAGAIDVTGGATVAADLLRAHDDLANAGCNDDGGNDVFYQVVLVNPEVYYFDTFGSSFDTSIRVFPGVPCSTVAGASNPVCDDDECGGNASQLALQLPAGASCVVVDKNEDAGVDPDQGALQLHVVPGGRTGMPLPRGVATQFGDTCQGVNTMEPPRMLGSCQGAAQLARDLAYFFNACPDHPAVIDASTCANPARTHYDTELYIRSVAGVDLDCEDDDHTCGARPDRMDGQPDGSILTAVATRTTGLHWLVVDGFAQACGRYQLDTNLR
jgi:hypothetical protein